MKFKTILAIKVANFTSWFLQKILKRGASSLPGYLAIRIDKNICNELSKEYKTILVTGTNGKTLTTNLITNCLKEEYDFVISNSSGSNMIQGITSMFIENYKKSSSEEKYAVIEVDEANIPLIVENTNPITVVVTNLFRDQMDRFGEIYTTWDKIKTGLNLRKDMQVFLNADVPVFSNHSLENPIEYFGFDFPKQDDIVLDQSADSILCPSCQNVLKYNFVVFNNLGDYYSPNCHIKRPTPSIKLEKIIAEDENSSKFIINGNEFSLNIGGVYNIYNALSAYAVCKFLNISNENIQKAFNKDNHMFGRQESIGIVNKEATLILVKNPTGFNTVIDMIKTNKEDCSLVLLLNANHADGTDTSWIYDVKFEEFKNMPIKNFIVGGDRKDELLTRLKVAYIDPNIIGVNDDLERLSNDIFDLNTQKIYILSSYTAMLNLRNILKNQGYITKEGVF